MLLNLIEKAYENHGGTIWIFTSAERIPDFADLRQTLLNDIVQEEIIGPTDIGLNAEVKGNFQLYNFERTELY